MITYKSTEDFEKMRKAGKVVSNIHYEIFDKTKSGMTLLDLDLIAKEIIDERYRKGWEAGDMYANMSGIVLFKFDLFKDSH